MSITWTESDFASEHVKNEAPCFYCGRPLSFPFILWMGTSDLALHPHCVVELSIRLFRDVHEVECKTDYVTAHSTLHLREKLRRQEGLE